MNSCVDSFTNPFAVDITEIEGFDNLHHPEGILKDSMKWAADVYGADQTYYLINGSTGGILAAVCGSVPRGGRILVSRNCHKSVYHGICLNQLKTSYVYPQEIEGLGIQAEKDLVSLITCTPYGLNTKRLVVTGERIPYTEKQEQEIVPGSMSFRELVFTALPFLYLAVGIGSMIRKKRGKRSSNETQKD